MSEKTAIQAAPPMYTGYPPNRMPYNGSGYQQYNTGKTMSTQNGLSNMQNLKASLPTPAADTNEARQAYSSPLMVLPSGQTVPLNNYYTQQNGSDLQNGLQYMPAGMFPGFLGNNNLAAGTVPGYTWPYGLAPGVTTLDTGRRTSWSSNEDNGMPMSQQPLATTGAQDWYPTMGYMPVTAQQSAHYIAGPIQPMKCSDNKSYEMVNMDELVSREPAIPRAVPALWTNQEELSLAKCLQNPEGITNVYIRGFMPETTDEDLEAWSCRFGEIESCKAIIEQDTGKCKGFGFVMYYSPAAAENCIRGFFHLGFQASYAQKSRNARLKDLEDRASTNIYCTGVPIDWNESDLAKHFSPYHAVSTKICRDVPSGVSKEVGFARFESREVAERVIREYHSFFCEKTGIKLCLRFADTKAQKQLKQQSQERRNWRSREYSYSVEHTPSPTMTRLQGVSSHVSPAGSYQSPAGASNTFTPATSVSPPEIAGMNKVVSNTRTTAWPMQGGLQSITNTTSVRDQGPRPHVEVTTKHVSAIPAIPETAEPLVITRTPSPKKLTINVEPASGKENLVSA